VPKTLSDIAKAMKDIDFAMLNSKAEDGSIGARPMSNNGDVDYDGDSWFFTTEDTRMVADIRRDPQVGLSFQGKSGMLGMRPFFVAVEGRADIVRDKSTFEAHWTPDLERWFEQGVDTPGLVMIHVKAGRLHYWDGEDEGEVAV